MPNSSYISNNAAWWSRPAVSIAIAAVIGAVLVLLAVVQYRWSGELAAAERERMQGSLRTAMGLFRQEFEFELARACATGAPWNMEGRSELVEAVFVWDVASERLRRAGVAPATAGVAPAATQDPDTAALEQKLRPLLRQVSFRPLFGCLVQMEVPALIHHAPGPPLLQRERADEYDVLQVNRDYLQSVLLPELARRHFGGGEYRLAVASGRDVLYDSTGSGGGTDVRPDGEIALLGPPFGGPRGDGGGPRQRRPAPGPPAALAPPMRGGPNLVPAPGAPPWKLSAQHRAGSLDAVVARQRRRNLTLSFGVLLLLASGMVLIAVSAQRAQRLARQQMDFVAGVTHELRTPLSVISSAADNLATGTVQDPRRVAEYGALIRGAGRRLTDTVEQVLLFARIEAGARHLEPQPIPAAELVQGALAEAAPLLEGVQVETQLDDALPAIVVDRAAALRCVGNLISNAVKYGGAAKWLGLRAAAVQDGSKPEVQITVEDRGMGIGRAELARVFDPFYRAPEAKRAQIHGTGLGLSLARDLAESMGGRISARSTPGQGSAFTLHLPAAI